MPHAASATFDIRSFGAVGDGVALATRPLQEAIDACGRTEGGTVVVPSGRFRTGAIRLRSGVRLHLAAGAVLEGSSDRSDYPMSSDRLNAGSGIAPLIGGDALTDVAISGQGAIDGNGAPWWREYLDWRTANEKVPGDPAKEPPAAPIRPRLLSLTACRNVRIEGVTLRHAPAWTLHLLACEFVHIDGIRVLNPMGHPTGPSVNTDGINPESCRNVWITNCYVAVGDDNITLKAGSEHGSLGPCENIVIANCITGHGHGGVVIGSEMSGGVRNVTIANCVFNRTYRGIRIKSRRGRGGVVENIQASNIVMDAVPYPFHVDAYYFDFAIDARHPPGLGTPAFRRLRFSEITAVGAEKACHLVGLPEMPIADVTFSGVSLSSRRGFVCRDVAGLVLRDVRLDASAGAPLLVERVTGLDLPAGLLPTSGSADDRSGQYQEPDVERRCWGPPLPT